MTPEYNAFCYARLQMQMALHDWLATHPAAADVAMESDSTVDSVRRIVGLLAAST